MSNYEYYDKHPLKNGVPKIIIQSPTNSNATSNMSTASEASTKSESNASSTSKAKVLITKLTRESTVLATIIRILQLLLTITNLVLAIVLYTEINFVKNRSICTIIFTVFTMIYIFYNILSMKYQIFIPSFVIMGELLCVCFWFIVFVISVDSWGVLKTSSSSSSIYYSEWWHPTVYSDPSDICLYKIYICHVGKLLCAFSFLLFFLFLLSFGAVLTVIGNAMKNGIIGFYSNRFACPGGMNMV